MKNLYTALKKQSVGNTHLTRILSVLEETLVHFNIPKSDRSTMGEALLRFRIVKDRNFKYNPDDKMLQNFLSLDRYFGARLQETVVHPQVPCSLGLTEQQLSAYNTLHLFHRLWTKAAGTQNYDKKEWQEFEKRLEPFFQ
jgi:hypothetical protein